MIKTCYFAGLKNVSGYVPVSIALWTPKWFRGESFSRFAPPAELIRAWKAREISCDEYENIFKKKILDVLPEKNILLSKLNRFGDKILLCCYEKPEDFCHRHLVAARLAEMGIPCEEFGKNAPVQRSLFDMR